MADVLLFAALVVVTRLAEEDCFAALLSQFAVYPVPPSPSWISVMLRGCLHRLRSYAKLISG